MKPFDLKKYLTENKATFHAALNEEAPYINPQADEIDDEDLEAASDYFDTMKESKLRNKIREMVLAEMNVDVTDETAGYDFLAELESMLDEEDDIYEAKKDEKQTDEETTDDITDEEEVDTTIDVDTDEVDPNVKAVQDALTQAQAAAQSLGDQKLSNQIGNTITYFTRAHISKPNNLR